MTLDLDLSASYAKLDRAEAHLDSLKAEIAIAVEERHPHSLTGEVDEQTGWCSIRLRRNNPKEPLLACILGDYIYNLKSALNYIVTSLVGASPIVTLGVAHQFPIYDSAADFATKVWRKGERVGRGELRGVVHGLTMIEPLQPYHTQPDPDADPLAQLNHLSNADKHRQILGYWPAPQPGQITVESDGGVVLDQMQGTEKQPWIHDEVEVGRLRFQLPVPRQLRIHADMAVAPLFAIQSFGEKRQRFALDVPTLELIGKKVRLTTDLFKTI